MKYRVTKKPHYINNQMHQPGAIVTLPEGVNPGKLLVPVVEKVKAPSEETAPAEKPSKKK